MNANPHTPGVTAALPTADHDGPIVVAHRGNCSVAPQNTLASYESGWRAGADLIEIDIQLTRDGQIVVIHDASVDATTDGTGALADLDFAAVRSLDAGSWFSPAYAGQRVPTLEEVIEFLGRRTDVGLLLEAKGDWTSDQLRPVIRALNEAQVTERVIAQSFSRRTVAALGEVEPRLRRGLLVGDGVPDLPGVCTDLGVCTCNPGGWLLAEQPDLLGRLHDAGLAVMVWTLNEPEQWAAAAEAGVDGIITDRPDRLAGWLAGRIGA